MGDFQKEELSLEETNKLRISLGLKPLVDDSVTEKKPPADGAADAAAPSADGPPSAAADDDDHDPLKNQQEKAAKNYAEYQESRRQKLEEDSVRERIAKAQNRRELNRKLHGRSLGEAEASATDASGESSGDAKKWIKAQRRKAKENAEKRLHEEAEAEEAAAAAAAKYDDSDLQGLKVGHDVDDLDLEAGGDSRILTLKDSKILDNEEDELMDTQLARSEQDRLNHERKKGAKKYTGLDDDEFDEVGGRKKGVLGKYDADMDGKALDKEEDAGFRLGGNANTRTERSEHKKKETERLLNRKMLDLDYAKNEEMSDYLKEGDVGFKKPKTKKKKHRATARIRLDDDDDGADAKSSVPLNQDVTMEDAEAGKTPLSTAERRAVSSNDAFIDDDDLAASLARARRKQAKRTFQKMTPEMIAQNLAKQREAEEAEASANDAIRLSTESTTNGSAKDEIVDGGQSTLTFDDTSEFVRNIQAARQASPEPILAAQKSAAASSSAQQVPVKEEPSSPSRTADGIDAEQLLQAANTDGGVKGDSDAEDEEMGYAGEDASQVRRKDESSGEATTTEPLVGGGLASTLSYLRNQGLITEMTPEQRERERQQREYDTWLAIRRVEDKVREAQMAASKAQGTAKDQATREYENRMRELDDARRAQDKFKNYTPDIDIKYHDEFGRVLNPHEAWKRLSHQFHGKMPGQKKQNQRLQRIEDERKQQKMLAGDTPSGIANAFSDRTERTGQAHMVLGVGNRNNAPQDVGMLGPNTLPRSNGTQDRGKARLHGEDAGSSSSTLRQHGDGMDSMGITSMIPRSTTARQKAGFAPVRNAASPPMGGMASRQPSNGIQGAFSDGGQHTPAGASTPDSNASLAPPSSKFKLAFGKRPAPFGAEAPMPKLPRRE